MMVSSFNSMVLKAKEAIVSRTDQDEAQEAKFADGDRMEGFERGAREGEKGPRWGKRAKG